MDNPSKKPRLHSPSNSATDNFKGKHRADGGSDYLSNNSEEDEQYQLLDEVTEENDDEMESDSSGDEDFDIEELDALLDEGLQKGGKEQRVPKRQRREEFPEGAEMERHVLSHMDKTVSPFYALPDGWIRIVHKSGMPLYLHSATRVCCASRPYFIGNTSFRKHEVPICAIPCLQYRKIKETLMKESLEVQNSDADSGENASGDAQNSTPLTENDPIQTTEPERRSPIDSVDEYNKTENCGKECGKSQDNSMEVGASASESMCPFAGKKSDNESLEKTSSYDVIKGEAATNALSKDVTASDAKENSSLESERPAVSDGFNVSLAKALNIHPKTLPPASTLLPANKAKISFEVQEPHSLSVEEFRDYCSKLFNIKTYKKLRFSTWPARRKFNQREDRKEIESEGTKLLTLETRDEEGVGYAKKKKKWLLNPKRKGSISILHEYVQFVFKSQPEYIYEDTENSSCPYAATIKINGMEYATGYGRSKRVAKNEAARGTLAIVMPEVIDKLDYSDKNSSSELKFFDKIRIEDPSVPELCANMSELPPYSLLLNCLKRNNYLEKGMKIKLLNHQNQKNEFVMTAGKHTVKVSCKNKKEGKQKASQALLKKLHPHIDAWGSMLRLYGNDALRPLKQKKKDEQEVTLLQNNATVNQPNLSIINMLRTEMLKLHEKRKGVQPIGTFKPPQNVVLPTPSSSDLNTLDL